MGGVRTVAGIFLIIAWIMLVVGGLAGLAVLGTLGSTSGGIAGAMIPLATAFAVSLSPFFLWAILQGLISIHEEVRRASRMLREMRDIEYAHYVTLQEATGVFDGFERASKRADPGSA